jgi:hypothetical protein
MSVQLFIYNKSILDYYLHILSNNNNIGICSDRQTGKSILTNQILTDYLLLHNNNTGIMIEGKHDNGQYRILRYLEYYGIDYKYKKDIIYFNNGSEILFKHELTEDILRRPIDIIAVDDLNYRKHLNEIIYSINTRNIKLLYNMTNTVEFDFYGIPYLPKNPYDLNIITKHSIIIDNTKINEIYLRKLKINKLKNDK